MTNATKLADDDFTVICCGGRDYNEPDRIYKFLDRVHSCRPIKVLIHGACKYGGADKHAEDWARSREVDYVGIPAKWKKIGHKGAGPRRNKKMLLTEPHLVIAFPGGSGTANMIKQATEAGVRTVDLSKQTRLSRNAIKKLKPLAAQENKPCCQYHKDGGDTYAGCADTEPREVGEP